MLTRDQSTPAIPEAHSRLRPDGGPGSALLPAVTDLLRRLTLTEPAVWEANGAAVRLAAELLFFDGAGRAEVLADVFSYRGALVVTVWIDHNRVFATRDGRPTPLRCFLNDYVASVRLAPDATSLPEDFVRGTVAGVAAARDGVRRYNMRCESHWFRVSIAQRSR